MQPLAEFACYLAAGVVMLCTTLGLCLFAAYHQRPRR